MLTLNRLSRRTARFSSRGGFTLVELLVVIGIIAILAGVALGPITNGIKQAKHNTAMQQCRQVGQVCFSYSVDNSALNNNGPFGADATVIAKLLLDNGYASDPNLFIINGGTTTATPATAAAGVWTVNAANVSWSFTQSSATAGITSATGDLTPVVFFNKTSGVAPLSPIKATAPTAVDVQMAAGSPQGLDGIAVFYKANNAAYIKGSNTGLCPGFISASDTDTTSYPVAP